jgi:hypothetical protein
MRPFMIEHAAEIAAINPSAARFALDEMFYFILVRITGITVTVHLTG